MYDFEHDDPFEDDDPFERHPYARPAVHVRPPPTPKLPKRPRDEPLMGMTRRDVEDLYKTSLRDTEKFLAERKDKVTRSAGSYALQSGEVIAGAIIAGYLAERFRTTSGVLPIGVVLGLAGHGAAYLNLTGALTEHVHNFADGAIAGSAAIWAAGMGAVAAEKAAGTSTGRAVRVTGREPPPYYAPPAGLGAGPLSDADFYAAARAYGRAA